MTNPKRLYVTLEEAAEIVSLSASTVQELVRKKDFPAPRMLSGRRVGWLLREVEEWAESRPLSDLLPPPNTGAKKPRFSGSKPVSQDDRQGA
ncbi:helix-turn-helix transcriptional regulator [Zoogloea dura]|uniref:AlpA family phage regulatory protein n=1 Tax=Zoogloea dura TaxID=2728840 RepID=A0A848G1H6_9RHOO|nr:AlpA family phage regulatory protein [Zoogloea dura]NML24293.1 AlpA family phage regulatory protein [Zoogloea dura]